VKVDAHIDLLGLKLPGSQSGAAVIQTLAPQQPV
jgi:hypothetical protein